MDSKKVLESFVEFLKSLFAALAAFLGKTIPFVGTLGNLADAFQTSDEPTTEA